MASFSTTMSEFSDSENRRTYAVDGHTVQLPKLVIQRRSVPKSTSAVGESQLQVVYGTKDSEGVPLASKVAFNAIVRYPNNGTASDVTAALAVFRDLVASDEFEAMVTGQTYIK